MSRMASANAIAPLRPAGTEEEDLLVIWPNDSVTSNPLLPLGAHKPYPLVFLEPSCFIQREES